jgi:hypothetical protein
MLPALPGNKIPQRRYLTSKYSNKVNLGTKTHAAIIIPILLICDRAEVSPDKNNLMA